MADRLPIRVCLGVFLQFDFLKKKYDFTSHEFFFFFFSLNLLLSAEMIFSYMNA